MSIRTGFIGLGNQGKPIAAHLAPAGFPTIVYDIAPEPVAELVEGGAKAAASPREVGANADLVGICVPEDKHVRAVDRLERARGLELEICRPEEEDQQNRRQDAQDRDGLGKVAGVRNHPHFADSTPDRHQEDAVVVLGVAERPGVRYAAPTPGQAQPTEQSLRQNRVVGNGSERRRPGQGRVNEEE